MNTNSSIRPHPRKKSGNFTQTLRILLFAVAAAAALFSVQTAPAANIVWVSDYNDPSTGFFPADSGRTDSGFVTLLQNAGHNVIRYNPPGAATTLMPQAEVDGLNTNDLIIIGRASGSGAFRLLQGNQWNTAVTKPLICMSPYLVRTIADNRMGWFTGGTLPDDTPTVVTAADPTDPATDYLLGGVTMLGNSTVKAYDEALDRNTSHITDPPVTGGKVLISATFPIEGSATTINTASVIADFQAGTVVTLSNAPLAAYRMYMAGGSREGATFPNAIPLYTGRENLTPVGEDIFLRAVQLALNSGVPPATDPGAPIRFTSHPASVSVARGGSVTLSVSVSGAAPRTLEWQRDTGDGVTFAAIPDASTTFSASSLTLSNLSLTDSGAKIRVLATNPNGTVVSDVATLTVTPDDAPPVPLGAATMDGSSIVVCFDELLNPAPINNPALDPFSYTVTDSGGAGVLSVTLLPDGRSVSLGLNMAVSPDYTLTIVAVDDLFGNGIPEPGVVLAGVHYGLTGANVGNLNPAGVNQACDANSFVVSGGGLNILPTSEDMGLAYKMVNGDFDARARVARLAGSDRFESVAKAILSARQSIDGTAPSVNVFVTPPHPGDGSFGATARTTTGAATSSNFVSVAYGPGAIPATIPNAWLRLTRVGDLFTTFGSANGTDWTQIGSITVAMGADVLVGAGVNSHRNGRLAFATFSNFTITPSASRPTITGLSFAAGAFSGSFQTQSGFNYVVQYKDNLNASMWQTLETISGDGTVKSFTDPGPAGAHRFYQVIVP
jgi:hypothetical protein